MTKSTMIGQILKKRGEKIRKENLYGELLKLNPNDPYAGHKARGSIGGSVKSNYIEAEGSDYICQRSATEDD